MTDDFHAACLAWPLLPDDELKALAEDIKARGLRIPIVRWKGLVVDGRNRLLACQQAGVAPAFQDVDLKFDEAAWDLCFSLNGRRRHLTREQMRVVTDARLKATPERSDRQIAKEVGVSNRTVTTHRRELEATVQIARLTKTRGADGRERPARRAKVAPPAPATTQPEVSDAPQCGVVMKTPEGKPVRVPGATYTEERKLVDEAVSGMELAEKRLRRCAAELGFSERSVATVKAALAALTETIGGAVHV